MFGYIMLIGLELEIGFCRRRFVIYVGWCWVGVMLLRGIWWNSMEIYFVIGGRKGRVLIL